MESRREIRQRILAEFFERDLRAPGAFRMRRLIWEVRNGRSIESIGEGLDDHLHSRYAVA